MSIYQECQYQDTPESSACGFYPEAGIHMTTEECSRQYGCPRPYEHHEFVPRADINTDLTDAEVTIVINALEAALALPEAMRKPYGLVDRQKAATGEWEWVETDAQDLLDRLLMYMDYMRSKP